MIITILDGVSEKSHEVMVKKTETFIKSREYCMSKFINNKAINIL